MALKDLDANKMPLGKIRDILLEFDLKIRQHQERHLPFQGLWRLLSWMGKWQEIVRLIGYRN